MPTEDIFEIEKDQGVLSGDSVTPPPPQAEVPTNPDLASGELKIDDKGAFFTPPTDSTQIGTIGTGEEPPASVAGQLEGLLSSESPYIKAAEAAAQRQSASRGLLNSSMAATAGRKAAIESALPIAQQDAGFLQESQLQKEQGEIQKGLYEVQGDISKELAKMGYTHETAMKEADLAWNKLDLESRMQVEYDKMDQDMKARFDQTTSAAMEDYTKQYVAILADPAFATPEDRQTAINALIQATQHRLQIAADIAQVQLNWVPEVTEEQKAAAEKPPEGTNFVPFPVAEKSRSWRP